MLRLKNIKLIDKILYAEYYPEDGEEFGEICINIETGEVVDYSLTSFDKVVRRHFSHAKQALQNMLKNNEELPKEKLVMWV